MLSCAGPWLLQTLVSLQYSGGILELLRWSFVNLVLSMSSSDVAAVRPSSPLLPSAANLMDGTLFLVFPCAVMAVRTGRALVAGRDGPGLLGRLVLVAVAACCMAAWAAWVVPVLHSSPCGSAWTGVGDGSAAKLAETGACV